MICIRCNVSHNPGPRPRLGIAIVAGCRVGKMRLVSRRCGMTKVMLAVLALSVQLTTQADDVSARTPSIGNFSGAYFVSTVINSFILGRPSAAPTWGSVCGDAKIDAIHAHAGHLPHLNWDGKLQIDSKQIQYIQSIGYWPYRCQLVRSVPYPYNTLPPKSAAPNFVYKYEFSCFRSDNMQ